MSRRHLLISLASLALVGCASAQPKPDETPSEAEQAGSPAAGPAQAGTLVGPEHAPAARRAPAPAPPSPQVQGAFEDALRHARSGDYPTAISLLQSVLSRAPTQAWAAYDLGICYERTGQSDRAAAAYRQALSIRSDLFQAAENLTHLYLRRDQAASAESELRGLIAKTPAAIQLHGLLAQALEAEGRYDDAAGEAKQVLKADERNVPGMLELASIYFHQKRFELARMVTENARQIDGSNALVYSTLAFLDLEDKNQALALEDLRKAAELREDLPEIQNNLGALLVRAQDYPSAIQHLQLAVHDAPDFSDAHLNLGNAYRGNKQYDLAKAEYEKALALDPKQIDGWFNLGVLYLDGTITGVSPLDRIDQSIAYLQKFQSAGGEDSKVAQYLSDAQKDIGKEKRREEVERRDKLRKAAEQAKKAAAQQKAAEEAAKKGAEERRKAMQATGGGSRLQEADPGPTPASYPSPSPHKAPPPAPQAPEGDKLGGDSK